MINYITHRGILSVGGAPFYVLTKIFYPYKQIKFERDFQEFSDDFFYVSKDTLNEFAVSPTNAHLRPQILFLCCNCESLYKQNKAFLLNNTYLFLLPHDTYLS